MVNNVGFSGGYNNFAQYSAKDIENITKYALGTNIVTPKEGPLDGMGMMLGIGVGIEAFKGLGWLRKAAKYETPVGYFDGITTKEDMKAAKQALNPLSNGGWKTAEAYTTCSDNIKKAWNKFTAESTLKANEFKAAGGYNNLEAYKMALRNHNAEVITNLIPTGDKVKDLSTETKSLYEKAKTLAEMAAKDGKDSKQLFAKANEYLAKANAAAHAENLAQPATGFFGKLSRGLGISHANAKMAEFGTKSPLMAKVLKHGKGQGLFLIIEGATALFTIVPTFSQLGVGSGIKQTGKSIVKSGASIGGWIVGSAIAAKGGAALGAAIGSVGGPVGTVVGGVVGALCGLVGGTIGSWIAKKGAEKLVGKDELDIAKEKEVEEASQQATQDPKAIQQLMATAAQRLQQEGGESEDAKIAFTSMQNIANSQAYANENTKQKRNTQFQGSTNPFSQADYMNNDFMAMGAGLA